MWFSVSSREDPPSVLYGVTFRCPLWQNLWFCLEGDYGTKYASGEPLASLLFLECGVAAELALQGFASPYLLLGGGCRRFDFNGLLVGEGVFMSGAVGLRVSPSPSLVVLAQLEAHADSGTEILRVAIRGGVNLRL